MSPRRVGVPILSITPRGRSMRYVYIQIAEGGSRSLVPFPYVGSLAFGFTTICSCCLVLKVKHTNNAAFMFLFMEFALMLFLLCFSFSFFLLGGVAYFKICNKVGIATPETIPSTRSCLLVFGNDGCLKGFGLSLRHLRGARGSRYIYEVQTRGPGPTSAASAPKKRKAFSPKG